MRILESIDWADDPEWLAHWELTENERFERMILEQWERAGGSGA